MNLRFITDEDVPRSTARVLRDAGFDAIDVRDVGLRGSLACGTGSWGELTSSSCYRRDRQGSSAWIIGVTKPTFAAVESLKVNTAIEI